MQARGKTEEDVAALLDAGVYDMEKLLEGGWLTGLKYADEVQVWPVSLQQHAEGVCKY